MEPTYLQPREGITGTLRDQDDLLSLDELAIPRRMIMCAMAKCLQRATMVGNPAPVVARMDERMRNPQAGDLVVETSRLGRNRMDVETFGILLGRRDEWWQTDEEWAARLAGEREAHDEMRTRWPDLGEFEPDKRMTDDAWYVQYGPQPGDVCRWVNCEFMAIPTDPHFAEIPFGTTDGASVTVDRSDLLGHLADSGFHLRMP